MAVLATTLLLYAPALRLELIGDDYQWVQHAHRAMHHPTLLFADLDTFYRPATTWTLIADRLLWDHRPSGFHLTNLILHACAGMLLLAAGRRLGLGWLGAVTVGLLWVVSPFADEPAISVSIRFEDLLLASWLGLIVAWPRPEEGWTKIRVAAVAGLAALALASKETWVVTPGLVWVLERSVHHRPPRRSLASAGWFAAAVALYAAAYFAAFPGGKGYFNWSPRVLAKVPHEMAAFLSLETLDPLAFPLTWKSGAAVMIVGAATLFAVRASQPAGNVGLALLLLPTLPTLFVPYLPTRYTAIPFVGFLLVAAAAVTAACNRVSPSARLLCRAVTTGVGALAMTAWVFTVRADIADANRVSAAQRRLLAEAHAAGQSLPMNVPVVVLRSEAEAPLAAIAATPRGLPKLLFPRPNDPYALADTAAVFEWVLGREQEFVDRGDARSLRGVAGALLLHGSGAFRWSATAIDDVGGVAETLRARGMRLQVILRHSR